MKTKAKEEIEKSPREKKLNFKSTWREVSRKQRD